MRKHFLILMLMALLPLAGFAADVAWPEAFADLSDGWSIRLSATAATYTGTDIRPDVVLVKTKDASDVYVLENGFNVSWSAEHVIDFASAGYTVTVTADDTKTFGALATPTAKFMVMKANLTVTATGALQDTPASGTEYSGATITLVKTAPTVKIGATETVVTGLKYAATASTVGVAPSTGWSTDYPTAQSVGTYKVWFKAEATSNYNEKIGTVGDDATYEIAGKNLVVTEDYVAPLANDADLTFTWQNNAPKELNLLKTNTGKMVGTGKGTMLFAVDPADPADPATEWTPNATASSAGTHTVYWKILGGTGYNNLIDNSTQKFTKEIGVATTAITFTAASGQSNLKYKIADDHKQGLIKTAATASNGASTLIKYQAQYSPDNTDWSAAWYPATATTDITQITGTNAGYYKVKALIEDAADDNYGDGVEPVIINVNIAKNDALTAAPTFNDLTWNNDDQVLITAGANTVEDLVEYYVAAGNGQAEINWTTTIGDIIGKNAGDYTVKYRVQENQNFNTVPEATITGTKIKRQDLSVKVNNITKSYNGLVDYAGAVVDNGLDKFTFMGRVEGDALDFSGVAYDDLEETCKNADSYTDAVAVTEAALEAVSPNYRYTVIPGNLTIAKAKLTVTAKDDIKVVFGTVYDISNEYTIAGLQNGEEATAAFATLPVLTTDAPAVNPAPDVYDIEFTTKGTLKTTNNYEMSDAGEDKDGYVIGDRKFTVLADPDAKVIITVLPHTQTYTGVGEDWSGIEAGTDYIVTGLISGDALTTAPKFKREKYNDDEDATNDKFDVDVYDLEAYGAAVANISKYPGGIIYQKSTFTITPAPLTVTVNQQTVSKDALVGVLDQDDWTVEGLVGSDEKDDLNGTLAFNTTYGETAEKANVATPGSYAKGIELTIDNDNYELKGANVNTTDATKAYGRLIVIAANTIALQVTDEDLQTKLTAAQTADVNYQVTFAGDSRVMEAKEWYAMVLPFETTPLELAKNLNTYVVVNVLKSSKIEYVSGTGHNRDEAIVNFGIEMDKIPAGTPFLIKPAAKTKWNTVENATNIYTPRKIKAAVAPTVTDKATLSATYESGKSLLWGYELDGTVNADKKYRWLANSTDERVSGGNYENKWYNCMSNAHALEPMEAFLILDPAAQGARIFVEDFENGTTAIQSLNADEIKGLKVAEGWYTVNGMKLEGMPTEKGIYINNGKKVVIK
jgi:hypothetical protein